MSPRAHPAPGPTERRGAATGAGRAARGAGRKRAGRRAALAALGLAALHAVAAADPLPGAEPFPPELARRIEAARRAEDPAEVRTRHRLPDGSPRFTNRLVLETSPYLRQHAHDPVDWYPWGDEAFRVAVARERPVLLSVGYSTCHWCHVMEEESFEDLEIAEYLNRHYVAIKVDREERPDVDAVYMAAVQLLAGHGGWPMTVWLTPSRRPFYAGTYFPPRDGLHPRRPGLLGLLRRLEALFRQDPLRVADASLRIAAEIEAALAAEAPAGTLDAAPLLAAARLYRERFDARYGGLRSRTKFPSHFPVPLALRIARRTRDAELASMAERTLEAIALGGLRDHVGGGFHRYATDPTWSIPHFEKMLYDNAQLAVAFLEGAQALGRDDFVAIVRETLGFLERDMRDPATGLFHAAIDADSEGEEGRFYTWTREGLEAALGAEGAARLLAAYELRPLPGGGGRGVLRRRDAAGQSVDVRASEEARPLLARLREARSARPRPHVDRKAIVGWNALAVSAFARAGLALGDAHLVALARVAGERLAAALRDGRLPRYLWEGQPHGEGQLEDYALLAGAALDLLEATGEARWLELAAALEAALAERFFDAERGGYWDVPPGRDDLLVRPKTFADGALPSGNAAAALALLRLALVLERSDAGARAEMTLRAAAPEYAEDPGRAPRMLEALDFFLDRPREIVLVAPERREELAPFLAILGRTFVPNRIVLAVTEREARALAERVPLLAGRRALRGRPTAYVCEARVCDLPTPDPEAFRRQLAKPAAPYPPAAAPGVARRTGAALARLAAAGGLPSGRGERSDRSKPVGRREDGGPLRRRSSFPRR